MKPQQLLFSATALFLSVLLPGCSHESPETGARLENEEQEGKVRLSDAQISEFRIELATAGPQRLEVEVSLPGEVAVNADRLAHIVPRVPGVVKEVRKTVGDVVKAGDVMAVLESRQLAEAKANFLAARSRVELAKATFGREERLWKKEIGSEQEYLEAKNALAEAEIGLRSLKQSLHALGLSESEVAKLPEEPDTALTRHEITAPFEGEVIERHIVQGEMLKEDSQAFVVADLSTVWVNLTVYQKNLSLVRTGQKTRISTGHGLTEFSGSIAYVSPLVEEATRTATARVVLENPAGTLRPGLFVTAEITVAELEVSVAVPRTALVTIDEHSVVFAQTDDGFTQREVEVGRSDKTHVEIISGLSAGQTCVVGGAFSLKAELEKEAFGEEGHDH